MGIGIQNFPEGLAVSLPLKAAGMDPWRSFWYASSRLHDTCMCGADEQASCGHLSVHLCVLASRT